MIGARAVFVSRQRKPFRRWLKARGHASRDGSRQAYDAFPFSTIRPQTFDVTVRGKLVSTQSMLSEAATAGPPTSLVSMPFRSCSYVSLVRQDPSETGLACCAESFVFLVDMPFALSIHSPKRFNDGALNRGD